MRTTWRERLASHLLNGRWLGPLPLIWNWPRVQRWAQRHSR